jgi:hypothetical protein
MAQSLFRPDLSRLRECKGGWMYQETNLGEPVRGTTRDLVGGDYLHRIRQKQNARRRKMLDVPLEAEAKTSHFMLVFPCSST